MRFCFVFAKKWDKSKFWIQDPQEHFSHKTYSYYSDQKYQRTNKLKISIIDKESRKQFQIKYLTSVFSNLINCGHETADEMLKSIASLVKKVKKVCFVSLQEIILSMPSGLTVRISKAL